MLKISTSGNGRNKVERLRCSNAAGLGIDLELASYQMRLEFEIYPRPAFPCLLTINKTKPRRRTKHSLTSPNQPLAPNHHKFTQRVRILSLVVDSALGGLTRGHVDILDDDSVTLLGSGSDPSSLGASTAGDLEEVVDVSGGGLPGLTAVATDLELEGTQPSVHDSGSKPVLRASAVHLDLKTIDDGARNEFPLDGDLAEVLVGDLGEHVGRHVQVVLIATGLVGNLTEKIS